MSTSESGHTIGAWVSWGVVAAVASCLGGALSAANCSAICSCKEIYAWGSDVNNVHGLFVILPAGGEEKVTSATNSSWAPNCGTGSPNTDVAAKNYFWPNLEPVCDRPAGQSVEWDTNDKQAGQFSNNTSRNICQPYG